MHKQGLSFLLYVLMISLFSLSPAGAIGDVITYDNAGSLDEFMRFDTPSAVYSVAWTSDSTTFAYGMADGSVGMASWDSVGLSFPMMVGGHTDAVTSVDFNADESALFSGGMDGVFRAWNHTAGTLLGVSDLITAPKAPVIGTVPFIQSVAGRPDSPNEVALAGNWNYIQQTVWNSPVRPGPPALSGHSNFVFDIEWHPSGDYLASGGADGTVRLWNYLSGAQNYIDNFSHTSRVYDIAFSRNGEWLASTGQDRTVWIRPLFSPGEPALIATIPDIGSDTVINAVDVSLNGDLLAIGDSHGMLRLYSIGSPTTSSGVLLREINAHDDQIKQLAFSPDGTMIATAGFDSTVKIWNITGTEPILGEPPVLPDPVTITGNFCPPAPPSRVTAGMRARITYTDGTPLRLRESPTGTVIRNIAEGVSFDIIGGPTCASGYTWWQIRQDDGITGWVAEGDSDGYFIEPMPTTPAIGTASIGGVVWHDICDNSGADTTFCINSGSVWTADGFRAGVEPILANVTVNLSSGSCPPSGAVLLQTITALDGTYTFDSLGEGTYCISVNALTDGNDSVLIPGAWTAPAFPTAPLAYRTAVVATAGETISFMDFGWDYQYAP